MLKSADIQRAFYHSSRRFGQSEMQFLLCNGETVTVHNIVGFLNEFIIFQIGALVIFILS